MARHSFIQMSKLSNVKGRISYITSHAKQENLYATYRTADNEFWSNLARESQQEFKRSGTEGKCIEARELIIALPEVYTRYEPQEVLEDFTEEFRKRYGVECVSALHHNKRKTNYHIHLIFSERKLLPEPDIKRATRSVFYDETGKRVRTKKEITGEDGQIRKGCTVIKKGEVYESHLFTVKDDKFKSEPFLREIKEIYTDLINRHISDPEQQLKVFDKNSVYLPTKKIGKNNPKAAEIEADNTARQEWNRTADMALLSGISEAKILEVKQTEIHEKASQSIKSKGWLPNLFRGIVAKAKDFLQNLIREKDTGSDTAYFPHFHCSSQVVREIIIDIISIGMSKKLIYIVPLFSNMNINAIIMAISIITRGKPYFFLIVRKSFVNSPFISFPPLHRKA